MPTLKQLRYLVALADQKHFRRAAENSNITQPTLSAQIKELELRLGTSLVERTRPAVILTPVGREIVRRARHVLTEVEDIRAIARLKTGPLAGKRDAIVANIKIANKNREKSPSSYVFKNKEKSI